MKYTKKAFTVEEHIDLLESRNLIISDRDRARKYLESVSYYRLSGYMFHLQDKQKQSFFYEGTTFADVINIYTFDKKLRCIFLEYLERIEVCFRTRILNQYAVENGFYWSLHEKHFIGKPELLGEKEEVLSYEHYVLKSILEDFSTPKEQFLKAFKNKYTSETYPPENMFFEILSFGKMIKLYTCLKNNEAKNAVALSFRVPSGKHLVNWLLFLNDVRNVCAHHTRLWNRRFTANKLIFPSRKNNKIEGHIPEYSNSNIYGAIIVINHLLASFNPHNSFVKKVEDLVDQHSIAVKNLGFPDDWQTAAPWRLQ
ncbi:Abortive infection bacteriophage resistance protein [Sphingobacterium nematocida]|uniref:Abortive infection bacteriophage resistance protein n=1 Tax=Sphingobacterium nematocida TaxID=1513896 RepID=A0A1T5G2W8_9SPHI|nr:Abi family protein [Sphingobacterium nematocida]SKC02773.1 Abortive infection bacteriophage resistance protein [Sphingobacterium nematocida]